MGGAGPCRRRRVARRARADDAAEQTRAATGRRSIGHRAALELLDQAVERKPVCDSVTTSSTRSTSRPRISSTPGQLRARVGGADAVAGRARGRTSQSSPRDHPIVSVEDPLAEDDWDGWAGFTARLGDRLQIVGRRPLHDQPRAARARVSPTASANAVLVKMNQIGTISRDARRRRAREAGRLSRPSISARSGETEDPALADLAVGVRRRADQGRLGHAVRAPGQVQPAAAHRAGARGRRGPGARRGALAEHRVLVTDYTWADTSIEAACSTRWAPRSSRRRRETKTSSSSSCATPTRSSPASRR